MIFSGVERIVRREKDGNFEWSAPVVAVTITNLTKYVPSVEYLNNLYSQPGPKYQGYLDSREEFLRDFVTVSKTSEATKAAPNKVKHPDFTSAKINSILAALIDRAEKLAVQGEMGKMAYFKEDKNIGIKHALLEYSPSFFQNSVLHKCKLASF